MEGYMAHTTHSAPWRTRIAHLWNIQTLRLMMQAGFALFILYTLVIHALVGEGGNVVTTSAEAYCPFGGIETLYAFISSGGAYVSHTHLSNLVILASVLLLAACGAQSAPAPVGSATPAVVNINVGELKAQFDRKQTMLVLDVRSAEEYAHDGHVAGSMLIPLPELERRVRELPTDRPIVCICRSGNRSTTACDLLARQGFTQLRNVQGGMIAWGQAGYPIERR